MASFSAAAMRRFMDPHDAVRAALWREMLADPVLAPLPPLSHQTDMDEQRRIVWRRIARAVEVGLSVNNPNFIRTDGPFDPEGRAIMGAYRSVYPMAPISYFLSMMFAGVCESLGTEIHSKYFRSSPAVQSLEIFGCFALTELTHGTNVQGIVTEAHYLPTKRQFRLHTPCNNAGTPVGAKWWVGNAGCHATHAVVAAQLYDGDRVCHGVHFFVVQLRDTKTLELMPGVLAGDMGPKPGMWNAMDNGFIVFTNVELPRAALLNRYQEMTDAGQYRALVDPRLRFGMTLGALSGGRVFITHQAASVLRDVMLISVRYSFARVQFGAPSRAPHEDTLMSYPLQQVRLLPFLAGAYAWRAYADWLVLQLDGYDRRSKADKKSVDDKTMLALNAELHAVSCGAKAVSTWYTRRAIEESRLACGGHGFSSVAGIAALRDFHDPHQTFEGDNNVLLQQLERWLLTAHQEGTKTSPMGVLDILHSSVTTHWTGSIRDALIHRVSYLMEESARVFAETVFESVGAPGASKADRMWDAWNACQPGALQALARAATECVVWVKFADSIADAPAELIPALHNVCDLFGTQLLVEDAATLLESGYINAEGARALRKQLRTLCGAIVPDALALVDAYAPPDALVHSVLGKSDGRYADHLWAAVRDNTHRVSHWRDARTPAVFDSQLDYVSRAKRAAAKL